MVLTPTGTLDMATYQALRTEMVKVASDEPRAVLVDVRNLDVSMTSALALFPAVAGELTNWLGLPLLLIDADDRLPPGYRMRRWVPVHRSLAAAVAGIGDPPPRQVATRRLPNSAMAPRLGREFVRTCCRRWAIDEQRAGDALLIANELIENTVMHTFYPAVIRMALRRDKLTVAVSDLDPAQPPVVPPDDALRGMTVVHKLSRAWGVAPSTSGGKVVWACL